MENIAKTTRITAVTLFALLLFSCSSAAAEWISMESGSTEPLKDVWGTSSDNVFAVGSNGTILHYNGTSWSEMEVSRTENFQGIWGSSSENIFSVGDDGLILQYDGNTWTKTGGGTSNNLNAVWGSSGTDLFVVGENGTILRCEEGSCSKIIGFTTNFSFNGVWGSSASDVFAVGGNGNIFHFNGADWSEMDAGTDEILLDVWGTSSDNVFAVGENGTILHYDGESWTKMPVVKKDFQAVEGASSKYVLAAGDDGKILRYNGSSWTEMDSRTNRFLQGVWVSPSNDSFAVGSSGTILFNENGPPTALFSINPGSGFIETTYFADASESFDGEDSSDDLQIRWDWENDGVWDTGFSTDKTASHKYTDNNTYTIVLEVKDTGGRSATVSNNVLVKTNKIPTALFTVDPPGGTAKTVFTMDASGSFDGEDGTDELQIRWDWENDGVWDTGFSAEKTATHQFQIEGTYLIRLEVKDSGGLTDSTTEEVRVGSGGCIATELLGREDPRLEILRKFRDQVLVKSHIGRLLIKYYYSQDENFVNLTGTNPAMSAFAKALLEETIPLIENIVKMFE